MKYKLMTLCFCCIAILFMMHYGPTLVGYSTAFSYYGSKSSEVRSIQEKLKAWGYYKGTIDAIYGYETFVSVKSFQRKNGLPADGICGPDTLAALGISSRPASTPASTVSRGGDRNESLLAHLIHGEARGEPYIGQVAVGAVVLNRVRDSRFPKTIPTVIYQKGAFDAVNDGQINLPADNAAFKAARDALNGWDPSSGAVYYFNPNTATSKWIWSRTFIKAIGRHYFSK